MAVRSSLFPTLVLMNTLLVLLVTTAYADSYTDGAFTWSWSEDGKICTKTCVNGSYGRCEKWCYGKSAIVWIVLGVLGLVFLPCVCVLLCFCCKWLCFADKSRNNAGAVYRA